MGPSAHVASARLWKAIAAFMGLCMHSFIAGLSLGVLLGRDHGEAMSAFAAIVSHKAIASFALGASFVRARGTSGEPLSRCAVLAWIVAFSAVTPLGVILGHAVGSVVHSQVAAALSAVAAGTFVYVGLVEIAIEELGDARHQRGRRSSAVGAVSAKAAALLAGYALMALLAVWV